MRMLESVKSGALDGMTNDELWDLISEERLNTIIPNCLLLLLKIINFEDRGAARLRDKGFANLSQREERDVRHLRRNAKERCEELLHSLRAASAPLQVEKGGRGLFASAGSNMSFLPLVPSAQQTGLHYNLRLSLLKLVQTLNGAFTYRGRGDYDADRNELARAFRLAAGHLEWALAQHAASTRTRAPEADLAISSQLSLLTISSSPRQTEREGRPRFSPTRLAPTPSSAYPQTPPSTPPRRPTSTAATPTSRGALWPSPPAAPQFGVVSPIRSPQVAASPRHGSAPTCTNCKQSGHGSPRCPKTQCYRCRYP